MSKFYLIIAGLFLSAQTVWAEQIDLQILHTNDIHSHFDAPISDEGFGGVARIKTLRDRLLKPEQGLFLDAGDFSEGGYGYAVQGGVVSFKIMAALGYDAVTMGNHEWLNGLQQLVKTWDAVDRSFPILSANLAPSEDDAGILPPYQIFEKKGLKVAVLGLSTNEIAYQKYLRPFSMSSPTEAANKWIKILREQKAADVVIVLSHLGRESDADLATRVQGIDLIVGGHSHELLQVADVIANKEDPTRVTPIVQTGHYGRYVGETMLAVDTITKKVSLKTYKLHGVKSSLPEDPKVKALVDLANDEANLVIQTRVSKDDQRVVATQPLTVPAAGPSNLNNLIADAYRDFAHADIGMQLKANIGGVLLPKKSGWGKIDLFNVLPFIFDPSTQKTWTVHKYTMTIEQLKGLLRYALLFSSDIGVSGIQILYEPASSLFKLDDVLDLQGVSIPNDRLVTVATTNVLDEFRLALADLTQIVLPIESNDDTGFEAWDVVFDYLQRRGASAIDAAQIHFDRMIPVQADLHLPPNEVKRIGRKLFLPIYNLGLDPVKNGYRVQVWQSPIAGEESDTVNLRSYQSVYDETFEGEWGGQQLRQLVVTIPKEIYLDQKRKFITLVRMIEQKEPNHMDNFQEFFLD